MADYMISDTLREGALKSREKLHPWDTIPAARCAFVVIDMQRYFVEGSAAVAIAPAINRLAAEVRANGGLVVWVQNTTADTRDAWSVRHELLSKQRAEMRLAAMQVDAAGFELWPTLDVYSNDMRVVKRFYSAFAPGSSTLPELLREQAIDFVLIGGTYTECCSLVSAQDAMMANFRTIMVSDCNAGSNDATHAGALDIFFSFFGDVLTSDEVLARLLPNECETSDSRRLLNDISHRALSPDVDSVGRPL